jgi:hypothetical protein
VFAFDLEAVNLEIPDEFLSLTSLSPEWFNTIAQELDLEICASQELEAACRCFYDYGAISFFRTFFSYVFNL